MDTPEEMQAAEHHGLHRRMATYFGVLAAMFLTGLDQTIVATAAPRIVNELNGLDRLAWVTTTYMLTSTAILPIIGKLSEQLGRKRVFLSGIVIFLLGSALSGLAQDMNQLIAFRAFQGIGAGVLSGTAFAVLTDLFSPIERGRYMGFYVSAFGLASITGPLVGGFLTDNVGWRAIFYINLPLGGIVLTVLAFTFPSLHFEGERQKIDFIGAAGIGLGAASLVLGLSLVAIRDWTYPGVWVGVAGGLLVIVGTLFHEARTASAVMPIRMFKSSIYTLSIMISFINNAIMITTTLYLPLFLQAVTGLSATKSGLTVIPMTGGMMLAAAVGGFVISGTGRYKVQAVAAAAMMALAMFLLGRLNVHSTQLEVVRDMVLLGVGMGVYISVNNVAAQNAVPHTALSSATSTLQFMRQMGGTVGLAILGSLFIQNYRDAVQQDVPDRTRHALPSAFSALLGNPQKFFDGVGQHAGQLPPQTQSILGPLVSGVKMALATSLADIFMIGFVLGLVGLFLALGMREIPLRKTSTMEDRALARAQTSESGA